VRFAPAFWSRPPARPGFLAHLLAPLAWVWNAVTRRRLAGGLRERLPVPVICVGNLTAGGAGKTPAVLALIDRLRARGVAAHVISRGHGGSLAGPVRVDPERHTAAQVGDESLLLAAAAPVWIARDRAAAGRSAATPRPTTRARSTRCSRPASPPSRRARRSTACSTPTSRSGFPTTS
jgi:tetraacyldisaccharide 4'-kinase